MSILKWLTKKHKLEVKSDLPEGPTRGRYTVITIGNQALFFPLSDYNDGQADLYDVNIAVGIRLISQSLISIPWNIMRVEYDLDREIYVKDDEHLAAGLIYKPNKFHSDAELFTHIVQCLIDAGSAYIWIRPKSMGFDNGTSFELMPLSPECVSIEIDKITGFPKYYKLGWGQSQKMIAIEDMLHFRLYHFTAPYEGHAPSKTMSVDAKANRTIRKFNQKFFENGANFEMIFVDESFDQQLATDPESQREFLKSLDAKHKGEENAFKRAVLPKGLKPFLTQPALKDMVFGDNLRWGREQINAMIGIPPAEGGIYEYANYANALIQNKGLWEKAVIPYGNLIENCINRQLIARKFDEDHIFKFDYSNVKALQEDGLAQSQRLGNLKERGIISVNEARIELGKAPLEGEEYDIPMANVYSIQQNAPQADANDGGDARSIFGTRPLNKAAVSPRYKIWKAKIDRREIAEFGFEKIIKRHFREQKIRVLSALKNKTVGGLIMANLIFEFKDDLAPDASNAPKIFNIDEEKARLEKDITPFAQNTIAQAGQSAIDETGIMAGFNIRNPKITEIIAGLQRRSSLIEDTTYDRIKQIMQQAYDNGESLSWLEREINNLYREFNVGGRAMTAARTEMGAAVNGATQLGYKQVGVKIKQWLSVQDNRTRDGHDTADGQAVLIDNPFIVNGEMLQFPGDPNGKPENTINCRCAMTWASEND